MLISNQIMGFTMKICAMIASVRYLNKDRGCESLCPKSQTIYKSIVLNDCIGYFTHYLSRQWSQASKPYKNRATTWSCPTIHHKHCQTSPPAMSLYICLLPWDESPAISVMSSNQNRSPQLPRRGIPKCKISLVSFLYTLFWDHQEMF